MVELRAGVTLASLPSRVLAPLHHRAAMFDLTVDETELIRTASLEIWASNQRVLERARQLAAALATEGVTPVAIKGLAVVGDHASSDHRAIGDIDMLVSVDELVTTIRVLAEAGHPVDYQPDRLALRQRHAVIAPGPDDIWVDLHWRAGGGMPLWAARRELSAPWPSGRSVPAPNGHPLYGTGWRVLRPHDSLAVLALHGCRPANTRAAHLMADAHVLLSNLDADDASRVLRALDEVGHRGRGGRWLQRVADLFGTDMPEELQHLRRSPTECWAERLEKVAARRTRSAGAGPVGLALGAVASSASVTVTRPWQLPGQMIGRLRWERASQHHTRIEPAPVERW